jgi:hypothetical protein
MTDTVVPLSIHINVADATLEFEAAIRREEVEASLHDLICRLGKQLLGGVIQVLDDQLRQEVPVEWRNAGTEARTLVSSLGAIRYRRRIYVDEQAQRRKPVDELLGLPRYGRLSGRVKEIGASLASTQTYRLAADQLSYLTGTELSHNAVQRMAWAVGERIQAGEEAQRKRVFESGEELPAGQVEAPVLYGESDGVWIHLQREEKRSAEVRVAVMSTGRKLVGSSRYRLENKHALTALEVTSDQWQEQILREAHLTYALEKTHLLICGGDGGAWVRHSFERLGLPDHFVLDRFHLQRAARRAFENKETASQLVARLRQEGYAAVCEELHGYLQQTEGKPHEKLLEFQEYVANNQEGLIDLKHRGLAVGPCLGAIEGNVNKLVAHRMKGRGCSWCIRGAKVMLALLRHREELRSHAYAYLPLSTPPRTYRETQVLGVEYEQAFQAALPIFSGPDQNKPWVQKLHEWVYGR